MVILTIASLEIPSIDGLSRIRDPCLPQKSLYSELIATADGGVRGVCSPNYGKGRVVGNAKALFVKDAVQHSEPQF